ncbi:MAG: bacteriohemerythrin, partial [Deltaproteobacteria bacterium]|nr:bacteriohemerythrin [Deltaproteobacteria bacterium]
IGDAVNVASRVQGIAREVGCDVLLSESTHLLLPPTMQAKCRFVDRVLVKGRRRPVSVYEVFGGDPAPLRAAKLANLREFENATTLYHAGHIAKARAQFAHCQTMAPTDSATAYYLGRIDEQARSGLPPEPDAAAGTFVWLPEYDTGVAAIDEQHHHLVHLLEELRGAVVQSDRLALRRVLPALDDYARKHFQMEQAMMAQVDYPLVVQHVEEHQLFLAELARLQRQFVDPASDTKVLRFKVETFLQDWLVSHTTKIDKHFVVYRQAQLANHH